MQGLWLLPLVLAVVSAVFLLPSPEVLIARALERAGLISLPWIAVRGLAEQNDDFLKCKPKRRPRQFGNPISAGHKFCQNGWAAVTAGCFKVDLCGGFDVHNRVTS